MNGNSFVSLLLHTPLRGMLGNTMIITVTGRKSGKLYSTPVGFYEDEGCLWVLSSRDRTWWRNLQGGARVALYLRGKSVNAQAEPVLDEDCVGQRMSSYLHAVPMAAGPLGTRLVDGKIPAEDADRLAKERLFVRIEVRA